MTEERYEQFEAYLRETLDESQQKELLDALQDPKVQSAFEAYRSVRQTTGQRWQRQAATDAFTARLSELHEQYQQAEQPPLRSISRRRIMGLAAGVLLIIGISFVVVRKQQFSDQQLIAHHLAEYPIGAERGATGLNRYHKAMMAYQNNQWATAAHAFTQVPPTDNNFSEAQLLAGYAYLKDGAYQKAKTAFQNVRKTGTPQQRQNAEWHIALSEVPTTPKGQIPTTLQAIATDADHHFHQEARALISDLNSIWR